MKQHFVGILLLCLALMTGATMAQEFSDDTVTMASEAGTLTVPVPDGWVTSVFNTSIVYMANSPAALDNTIEDTFLPGEAQITLATVRTDYVLDATGMDEGETVMAILQYLLDLPGTTGAMPQTAALTTVNGNPVATAYLKAPESHSYAQIRLVSDETFLLLEVLAAPNELAQWQPLGEAVFAGIIVPGDAQASGPASTLTRSVELTETYSADDIAFTVDYPAGWATRPSFPNGVAIGSREAALDLWQNDAFAPGDAHAFIGYGTAEEMFEIESDEALTPYAILEMAIAMEADSDEFSILGPYDTPVGDWNGAYLMITMPESATLVVLADTGAGNYLSSYIQTHSDDIGAMSAVLWDMLDTLRLNSSPTAAVPTLTEVYTADDEGFSIQYPAGWQTRSASPNGVDIASSTAALDQMVFDRFAPGEFHAFIGYGPASEQFRGMDVSGLSPEEILAQGMDMDMPAGMTLGAVETLSVNDRRAAAVTITTANSEAFLMIVAYADDIYLTADIYTALDEGDAARELLLDMLETFAVAETAPVKQS